MFVRKFNIFSALKTERVFRNDIDILSPMPAVLFLVCAVLCVIVYFSLTKEDDGLTKAQRKELKAAKKAAAKGGK